MIPSPGLTTHAVKTSSMVETPLPYISPPISIHVPISKVVKLDLDQGREIALLVSLFAQGGVLVEDVDQQRAQGFLSEEGVAIAQIDGAKVLGECCLERLQMSSVCG